MTHPFTFTSDWLFKPRAAITVCLGCTHGCGRTQSIKIHGAHGCMALASVMSHKPYSVVQSTACVPAAAFETRSRTFLLLFYLGSLHMHVGTMICLSLQTTEHQLVRRRMQQLVFAAVLHVSLHEGKGKVEESSLLSCTITHNTPGLNKFKPQFRPPVLLPFSVPTQTRTASSFPFPLIPLCNTFSFNHLPRLMRCDTSMSTQGAPFV